MHSLLAQHKELVDTLIAYHVLSAALGSIPAPDASSTKFYRFCYSFANTVAANYFRAFNTKLPSGDLNNAENAAKELPVANPTIQKGETK